MSIAEKLTTIASNMEDIHKAGYDKAEDDFWANVLDSGNRTSFEYAFVRWMNEFFKPTYKVVPTTARFISTFENCAKLKKIEKKYIDCSGLTTSQTNSGSGYYATFRNCVELELFEDIGMKAGYYYATFWGCKKLKTIEVFRVQEDTMYYSPLHQCESLENITIEGTIGQSGLSFADAKNLTEESIISIVSALSTTASGKSITFSKTAINNAFGINVDDETTYPVGSEYHTLRHSKDNWDFNYS